MIAPELWLNGRRITGGKADRAPVLVPVTLDWGSDEAGEQPNPATLTFTVLFRDGMGDVPDLQNGAQVELIHPSEWWKPARTIFAGTISTMAAEPSAAVEGALEVRATAVDTTAEFDDLFVSANMPAGHSRPAQLAAMFEAEGWELELPADPRRSAAARYNSIKLATLLDRHITRYRGRRFDATGRDEFGQLRKRVIVTEGSAREAPADALLATDVGVWDRSYNSPHRDGTESPLVVLQAANIFRDVGWVQEAGNTTTAVKLTPLVQDEDGFTEDGDELNFRAASHVVATFGLHSVDVETDLEAPAEQEAVARAWMNGDSPWMMDGLTIRDTAALLPEQIADLLDPVTRNRALVAVNGVMHNRPDPGPSVLRSYIIGGKYEWNGKAWDMSLTLERTIYARPALRWTYQKLQRAFDPNIYGATYASVSEALSFADFREITAPHPPGTYPAAERWTWAALKASRLMADISYTYANPRLRYADFKTLRKELPDGIHS